MAENLTQLQENIRACDKCRLCETRTHVVFGEGNPRATLLFVGEGPGEWEDKQGRPFVGKAGQLLDNMMAAIGLKREEVYIANVVKCRPPGNRDPEPDEVAACIGHLREQVRRIHPKIIVCLGRIAMREILHETAGIMRMHGKVFYRTGFYIIPTYHPSALLRNPDLKREAWSDLKTVRRILDEVNNEENTWDLPAVDGKPPKAWL